MPKNQNFVNFVEEVSESEDVIFPILPPMPVIQIKAQLHMSQFTDFPFRIRINCEKICDVVLILTTVIKMQTILHELYKGNNPSLGWIDLNGVQIEFNGFMTDLSNAKTKKDFECILHNVNIYLKNSTTIKRIKLDTPKSLNEALSLLCQSSRMLVETKLKSLQSKLDNLMNHPPLSGDHNKIDNEIDRRRKELLQFQEECCDDHLVFNQLKIFTTLVHRLLNFHRETHDQLLNYVNSYSIVNGVPTCMQHLAVLVFNTGVDHTLYHDCQSLHKVAMVATEHAYYFSKNIKNLKGEIDQLQKMWDKHKKPHISHASVKNDRPPTSAFYKPSVTSNASKTELGF